MVNLKEHFLSYLNNFLRISKLQQRLLEERMALHQSPNDTFQGIDLDSANGIYLSLWLLSMRCKKRFARRDSLSIK